MKEQEDNIDTIIKRLTLQEKASLCSGQDEWAFKAIDRLHIPSIWLADGPHGLRKAPTSDVGGFGDQHPATCFPTASALAASWDVNLLKYVGQILAIECQALGVHILLGPGVNIKRSPTGGRNFEYFSEDPILSGELGAAYINGVQQEGVGTSLKHFACNTQETQRMLVSAQIDERTLREIYLPNFEIAVKKGNPWSVMAAYNPLNGQDCTANRYLLNDILKEEWGYQGVVVSDWVSVYDRVEGIKAGLHVEMPGNGGINDAKIVAAVKEGRLDEKQIDTLLKETLRLIFKAKECEQPGVVFDFTEHHDLARKVAAETMVLLKNDNNILPINSEKYKKIALIGEFAVAPRFQGNGSSEVKPTRIDTFKEEFEKLAADDIEVNYAQGYKLEDDTDESLIQTAVELATVADLAVVHVGLPQHYESEGYDRKHIEIPQAQVALIQEVAKHQKNTIVVLTNGAAIAMPWADSVAAILESWLAGQAGAGAIADILFGKVNPSGKLAETFPICLEDTPGFLDYPGNNRTQHYSEGVFVGYRWYDKRNIAPLFAFGHGLSYTSFEYSNIFLSKDTISEDDQLIVRCTIKNSGEIAGKEIVQLYVGDNSIRLIQPKKQLKAFCKVELAAQEEKSISFTLEKRDFSYYDLSLKDWVIDSGVFTLLIGASSRDIHLEESVHFVSSKKIFLPFDIRTTLREWITYPETKELVYPLIKNYFLAQPDLYEGDLIDFNIPNDFLLDMPMLKYVALSRGAITIESINDIIERIKDIPITL